MANMRDVAKWSLIAFVFVLPWERNVAIPVLGGVGTPVGLIALATGIASVFGGGKVRLRAPSVPLLVMTGFVLWSALNYYWSIDPMATLGRTETYFQLLLMAWLVWQLSRTRKVLMALLNAYVFGSLFAIAVVFVSFLRGDAYFVSPTTGLARFSFAGGDPNYFALSLVIAIPMAWFLVLHGRRGWQWWVNMAYIPLAVLVVGLSGSRGGAISALIALGVIPITYTRLRIERKVALVLALAGMAYGAILVIPAVTLDRLIQTPAAIAEGEFTGRERIWVAGVKFLVEADQRMLVGVGSANFKRATEEILGKEQSGHNAYLNVLVENGVIGLALFVAIFVTTLLPALSSRDGFARFSLVLVLCLAVGIFGLSWEREKPLWFALAIISAGRAVVVMPSSTTSQP